MLIQTLKPSLKDLESRTRTLSGLVYLDDCTTWKARPVFAFLVSVGGCLEDGEGVTGLLLLSIDPDHAVAVVVVRSVAGTPRSLYESVISQAADGDMSGTSEIKRRQGGNGVETYDIKSHHGLSFD